MLRYIKRWCAAMAQRDELRLVLYNVVSDLVKTRVPKEISATILQTTLSSWEQLVGPDPDGRPESDERAAAVLADVLAQVTEEELCRGPACPLGTTEISRITDHLGVWVNNIHKGAVAPPRDGLPDERFWRDVEADGLTDAQIIAGSQVRGGRPFAWITTRETLASIRNLKPSELATEVRDHLGLDHFEFGAELLEIEYPPGALEQTRVAVPTFVEGGINAAYKSAMDGQGWGTTRRLGGGEGGPEAVHPPIRFTHRFRIRYLGVVDRDPPPIDSSLDDQHRDWAKDAAEILMSIIGRDQE